MALSKNIKLRNIKEAKLDQDELKRQLHYDSLTGIFTRLESFSPRINVGDIAGCETSRGYIHISINGILYQAHRLAFLWMTGSWPIDQVDHNDRIKSNNQWNNLNEATHQENSINKPKQSNNTTGVTGVFYDKRDKRWLAHININRKYTVLGYFAEKSDAINARKDAELRYGYHPNHGK